METNRTVVRCMRGMDTLLTAACFVLAYFIKKYLAPDPYSGLSQEPNYYAILFLVIIIWYISFNALWIYKDLRRHRFWSFVLDVFKANLLGLLLLSFVLYAVHMPISRLMIGIFCVLNVIAMLLFRAAAVMAVRRMDRNEVNYRNIVIVGSRERAEDVIRTIQNHHKNNVVILGCFDPDPERVGKMVAGRHSVHGTMDKLKNFLTENVVDELIVAMPLKNIPDGDRYLVMAEQMGINARIVPDWQLHYLAYRPDVASIYVSEISGVQTLTLTTTPKNEGKLFIKALFDYAAAFIGLVISAPVFIFAAICIKAFSKGPVFYRQERLGQNGRVFEVLKFRTMVAGADRQIDKLRNMNEADGPVFKIRKDPRVIPCIGTFLRKTSLDELPQLINVLKGEMSLVGPRPPIPSEVDEYETWQRRRLSMKPGITCLWQIAPRRNELSFAKWVELDLAYIDKWSLRSDFMILFKTVKAVLTGAGR